MLEVADIERTCGDAPQGNRIGGKAGQHSRTALGGLVEQECAAAIGAGQGFGNQLALLELELALDAAL